MFFIFSRKTWYLFKVRGTGIIFSGKAISGKNFYGVLQSFLCFNSKKSTKYFSWRVCKLKETALFAAFSLHPRHRDLYQQQGFSFTLFFWIFFSNLVPFLLLFSKIKSQKERIRKDTKREQLQKGLQNILIKQKFCIFTILAHLINALGNSL